MIAPGSIFKGGVMKGRDLICYIMNNKLENVDFPIYSNDEWTDYITVDEASKKFGVKPETIIRLIESRRITGTILDGEYYIPKSTSINIKKG